MNIVLGVSGSVAAYRAADLARELMRHGFVVRVCLTDSAENFVSRALFEALTGQPCLVDAFEEPTPGRMAHIDWAREADAILIAPATANVINKISAGIADDMLTTIAVATTKPLIIAPAMNPQMYLNPATQHSLQTLKSRGVEIVEPTEGDVACGENGQGKLASISTIVSATESILRTSSQLKGKRILITSGPTQEPIDSVRYITNRSSGKMGSALAKAALRMGASVTVVAGPQTEFLPTAATIVRVNTAEEMLAEAQKAAPHADWIIGVAAVADYRIANPVEGKIRRESDHLSLELIANPDIIKTLAEAFPEKVVVGFAAEPNADPTIAREKINRKHLAGIAFNDISQPGIGFNSDENQITYISKDGSQETSKKESKLRIAQWLLEQILSGQSR